MDKSKLLEYIGFFKKLNIIEEDITSEEERLNGQKVVIAKYQFDGKIYETQKLYYRDISNLDNIKSKQVLIQYFGEPVYWLDIENHGWPQGSGESDLDGLVINDMAAETDLEFKLFLKSLANNQLSGYIQRITADGRSGQYYHNLENNNHWHDLVFLIKAIIESGGKEIDKKYFSRLVFKWDGTKHTARERSTLTNKAYWCNRGLVERLYENIKSIQLGIKDMENINLLKYKKQIILQGPPGTGKTYTAKEMAYSMIFDKVISKEEKLKKEEMKLLEDSGQYKLIQFHPSYSYEDFVRGITAKTNGNSIEYVTVNRILAAFAKTANENYNDSQKDSKSYTKEKWVKDQLAVFSETIQDCIETDLKFEINKTAYVFEIEEDAFRYTGDNWPQKTGLRMKFNDIILMYLNDVKTRQDVKAQQDISGLARQHASYFFKFFQKFQEFLSDKKFNETIVEKVPDKKYVLIIDEINRANLPSVLGELIYALEYRGESVEGMYELDGDRKIVLPPNLYFICTMNTADRSVGHIDYAIRRRFAFVNCPPRKSVIDDAITDFSVKQKASELYDKVESLFDSKSLASDFKKNDVQIGHSYFLAKTTDELMLKKEYEIKPILIEYLKDGILLSNFDSGGKDQTLQFIEEL